MRNVFVLILLLISTNVFAFDDPRIIPFEERSKSASFISFYSGMLIDISSSASLKEYVETRLPGYSNLPSEQRLSSFAYGIGFFIGGEKQISKNFSTKLEYTYRIKNISVDAIPNYEFSVFSHRPGIGINYIIPEGFAFIKIGGALSYNLNTFRAREFGLVNDYTGTGIGLNLETLLNLQMSNSLAVYLGGNLTGEFSGSLKGDNGVTLTNPNTNEEVNLSGFGVGLKLGFNLYFF